MDILEEIVAHKRVEIDERKRFVPLQQFTGAIQQMMDEGKPASMSEALAKLEAEGLVCRAPSEEDRRTFTVTITGQGRVHLEESRRRDEEEILRLYECLSAEERERLLELLGRLESFWREALPEDGENRRKKGGRRARPARG